MERFYASRINELISTIRSGEDVEIEQQLLFCEQWGGTLAAAAQVALAWVVERRGWEGKGREKQLQAAEPAKPPAAKRRATPPWVQEQLRLKAERVDRS